MLTRARTLLRAAAPVLSVGLGVGMGLTACRQPPPAAGLPDTLAVVLSTSEHRMVSVLVELPRPGVEPVVRLSPGAVAVDQGWVLAAMVDHDGHSDDQLQVMNLADASQQTATLSGVARVQAIGRGGVVVRDEQGLWRLDPSAPQGLLPVLIPPVSGGTTTHVGPAGGFKVRVHDQQLELLLPREAAQWTPIIHDVDALLGSWWFVSASLPPWQRRVVDDRFKQVGLIRPVAGPVTVDGDLKEWAGQRAQPVDMPSQILLGQASWHGARDGGMAVAARTRPDGTLVLAIRVRDDHWVIGQDALVVRLLDREIFIGLASDTIQHGSGWRAVVGERKDHERTVELALDGLAPTVGVVSGLMVELVDADPGEAPTLLATAPWPAAVALGANALPLRVDPGLAPTRSAPQ